MEGLTAWQEAGVDLAQVTYLGMSPLDAVSILGSCSVHIKQIHCIYRLRKMVPQMLRDF